MNDDQWGICDGVCSNDEPLRVPSSEVRINLDPIAGIVSKVAQEDEVDLRSRVAYAEVNYFQSTCDILQLLLVILCLMMFVMARAVCDALLLDSFATAEVPSMMFHNHGTNSSMIQLQHNGHQGREGVREQAIVDARITLIAPVCPSDSFDDDKAVGRE